MHRPTRIHVLLAGIFGLILTMGVARFAYTPLLPLMQRQAGMSLALGGWLAAINYAGYLTGAIVASSVNEVVLKDRLYRYGLALAVLTTAMMGLSDNPVVWAVSRYLAGVSTSAGMLLGAGLVLQWLMHNDYRGELGVHFSGVGLGIVVASAAVAAMNALDLGWRMQWFALTLLGLAILWPALGWLPRPERTHVSLSGRVLADTPASMLFLALCMAFYFCAGVGYVVTATFIVAIIDRLPGLEGKGAWVFLLIGVAGAPASILWDRVARRIGDVGALIVAAVIHTAGILLPALSPTLGAALLSAVLYGGTVIGIVSLVLALAGRLYPTRPAQMMGRMTIAFGVAQIVAPATVGAIAQSHGGYRFGLLIAASAMVLGVVFLAVMRLVELRERRIQIAAASPLA